MKNAGAEAGDLSTEAYRVLEKILIARHSCRAFKREPVPQKLIEQILWAGQRTASDCNIQPWRVCIVNGEALDRLRTDLYGRASAGVPTVSDIPPIAQYHGVYAERRRECGWQLYASVGVKKGDREASHTQALENFRLFGAPHFALITTDRSLGTRGVLDCGGYVTTFMLAAQALGVATIPQASIAHRVDVFRDHLSLADDQAVVCGISFGWPDDQHVANSFRMSRAEIADVVQYFS